MVSLSGIIIVLTGGTVILTGWTATLSGRTNVFLWLDDDFKSTNCDFKWPELRFELPNRHFMRPDEFSFYKLTRMNRRKDPYSEIQEAASLNASTGSAAISTSTSLSVAEEKRKVN